MTKWKMCVWMEDDGWRMMLIFRWTVACLKLNVDMHSLHLDKLWKESQYIFKNNKK